MRKQVNCTLPDDVKMIASYTGKKLGICLNVKNKTVFNHEHDIVYYDKSPEKSWTHEYVGESSRRVLERVKDHNGRNPSSHIFKHCVAANFINMFITLEVGSWNVNPKYYHTNIF